jgi:hypothetical protein
MAHNDNWTMMFFFAGNNTLSPIMIAQLKAIKDAGFQMNTNVVVYFDPNEYGVPTHIYQVNRDRKATTRASRIGDGADPWVRNLVLDNLSPQEIAANNKPASLKFSQSLQTPDKLGATEALAQFLAYCKESHPAGHYMLFLVGHGMVVGSDGFLPDDYPISAISLKDLGQILTDFGKEVRKDGAAFELLGLHSCSMSGVEIAYEIEGAAKYVIASQGIAFTDSWPYRQLLKKTFNEIEEAEKSKGSVDVPKLMNSLYSLCLYNSTDFHLAGYSFDLCLCDFSADKVDGLTKPLKTLIEELKTALQDPRRQELIIWAHWRSQSYWQESYTDLFDFCQCLETKLSDGDALKTACKEVREALDKVVLRSCYVGPTYQYSHGLSIFFPWSRPVAEEVLEQYEQYAFEAGLGGTSWLSFLSSYFEETKRKSRDVEDGRGAREGNPVFAKAAENFSWDGALSGGKPDPALKRDPAHGRDSCECPSIKNFPQETRIRGTKKRNAPEFAIGDDALKAFEP